MSLTPGTRLGSYEILAAIGAGGMGEVYRARDERLGRDVALKVLPASVVGDAERLARFDREAKLLASLSHPNIATLFAMERLGGQTVLAMELAAGEDLTARIDRGPMPLDEVLPIAMQVALALEAAHDKDIVHRDLKPANIKIGPEGAVKILDFGLAKALSPEGMSGAADVMNSPTLTAQATQAGIILGTAAYMSPEQARGRAADKRADIWSFGVVLFEMLTGARLFEGETISDTLAAVLRQEVDWMRLPPATPQALRQLLRRCLERDRRNRLHDIADGRIVLEEIARGDVRDLSREPAAGVPRRSRTWAWSALAAASVSLGALIGHALWPAPATPVAAGLTRFVVAAPPGVTDVNAPAMAPDGSFVVFEGISAGQKRLYVQRFDEVAPRVLEKTEGAQQPFVSFDGRSIGFRRNDRIERMPTEGGDPTTIVETTSNAPGATWGPDGTIVYTLRWNSGLMTAPADGGKPPRTLTTPDAAKGEKGHYWPQFLPGGKGVLYTVFRAGSGLADARVAVLDLASGKSHDVLPGALAFYTSPGFIVFYRAGAYHAVGFDLGTMTTTGSPARVIDDAWGLSPDGDETVSVAVSASGILAYRPGQLLVDRVLAWVGTDGKLDRLSLTPRPMRDASLSADGRRLAVTATDAGQFVIRIFDLGRNTDEVLNVPGGNQRPVWHPDGKRLAFVSMRKGDYDLYVKDTTSSGPAVAWLSTDRDDSPASWTPDGERLVIQQQDADGVYRHKLFDPKHPDQARTLTETSASRGRVSPDGLWMAYRSDSSGEAYVTALSGDRAPTLISKDGGTNVQWARRTHELYYTRAHEIVAARYQLDGDRFHVVGERVVVRLPSLSESTVGEFVLAPDDRILVFPPATEPVPPQLRIVINWPQEIARRLAAGK